MVRAIDRHESIIQSTIAERVQQIQQQHPDLQQRYFETQLSQEHRRMLQKVKESEKKDSPHLKGEGEKQNTDQDRQGKTIIPPRHDETSSEQNQSGHIDIKV